MAIGALKLGFFLVAFVATAIGVSTAIATAIVITAAVLATVVVAGILLRPKIPKPVANLAALSQSLSVDAFRYFLLGEGPLGNDERYWEVYGSSGYDQIIAAATHKITSFDTLYVEGVAQSFSGANAVGTFAGVLSRYTKTEGVTGTGIGTTVAGGTLWTTACSMTGLAYYLLKWTYDQKKLPNGFPSRIAYIGKGAPVYDPRRDSTVGGSGTHRANDQTTWEYTPTDSNGIAIGRNNALQMLWYLLGWRITNPATSEKVLVAGRGVDPSDIDFGSFIAAANACETEGYYTFIGGSTGDTHNTNENAIANGAQGFLMDTGGLWSYKVATNDTASIAVALTDDDVVSGASWNQKNSINEQYNRVGGTFIDSGTNSVYQSQPYPEVQNSTYVSQDNGVVNKQTLDFTTVIDATLAQKLARIWLNRQRASGVFRATFNWKILKAQNYDCVTLTFSPLGFSSKLFRITSMAINPQGGIDAVLQEEFASVYTGGTIGTYTPPSAGASYDVRQQIALSGLSATATSVTGTNGLVTDALTVSWTGVAANVKFVELQYKQHSNSVWLPAGFVYDGGVSTSLIDNLNPLTNYDVQARAVSINDVPGAWASVSQTTGNNTLIPSSNVQVSSGFSDTDTGTYSWNSPASPTQAFVFNIGQVNLGSILAINDYGFSAVANANGGATFNVLIRNAGTGTDSHTLFSGGMSFVTSGGLHVYDKLFNTGNVGQLYYNPSTTAGAKELVFQFSGGGAVTSISLGPTNSLGYNTQVKGSVIG